VLAASLGFPATPFKKELLFLKREASLFFTLHHNIQLHGDCHQWTRMRDYSEFQTLGYHSLGCSLNDMFGLLRFFPLVAFVGCVGKLDRDGPLYLSLFNFPGNMQPDIWP